MASQDFAIHFLDNVLFQYVMHINDFFSFEKRPSCFGHFVLMCSSSTFLSHMGDISFSFLPIFVGEFR
jgi:hypothetical protein